MDALEELERRVLMSAAPPTVLSVLVNGGSSQHSAVQSVAVQFSANVSPSLSASTLLLHDLSTNADVNPANESLAYNAASNTATWTFPGLPNGSLADGNYLATLPGSVVADAAGNHLDGDGAGVGGADYRIHLYRYFGDANGDRSVDFADLFQFKRAYQSSSADPNFNPAFDVNGDGSVDFADLFQFKKNYQQSLTAPPILGMALSHDTGTSSADHLTSDPSIAGSLSGLAGVSSLKAGFDAAPIGSYTNVLGDVAAGGIFGFSPARLTQINGGLALADGLHTLHIKGYDAAGQLVDALDLPLTLDTTAPVAPAFDLASGFAAPAVGAQTTYRAPGLSGTTEPNATVTLGSGASAISVLADAGGNFALPDAVLNLGANSVTLTATDAAGNSSTFTKTITRIAPATANQVALDWNTATLTAITLDASVPPIASRSLAMVSAAMYDAVNSVSGVSSFLYVHVSAPAGSSDIAAVAQAAHDVLVYLYPAQQAGFDAQLAASLSAVGDPVAKANGISVGQQVAAAILAQRANDGATSFTDYTPGNGPGVWQPTYPMYASALLPNWATLQPFLMTSDSQFRPAGPTALTSAQWMADYNQVKSLGSATSSTRTADQTQIARFWADGQGTITPAGHWNQIATQLLAAKGNVSLFDTLKLMAELNVSMGDAAIVAWDAKFTDSFWRPITAIQAGGGNAGLSADPNWVPLLVTPNFPEYISGHSTFSGAAAVVLANYFGSNFAFSATSPSPGVSGVVRSYASFDAAASEAGMSRIYGGIHYLSSDLDGLAAGKALGNFILARFADTTDTTPPKVTFANANNAAAKQNFTLSGLVTDNLSGVKLLSAQLDGGTPFTVSVDPSGHFTIQTALATNGTADGAHVLHLIATDYANIVSGSQDYAFTLDTVAPTITLTSPLPAAALMAGATLSGAAAGTGSALTALSYMFDSGAVMPLTFAADGSFSQTLDTSKLLSGAHTLTVTATDAAGNVKVMSVSVTLPSAAPLTISKVTPVTGSSDVGVGYRPEVTFTRAININTLNSNNFYLSAGGQKLGATIVPSDDGTYAWLFPTTNLPGGTTVTVTVDGTSIKASDNTYLDAAGTNAAAGSLTTYNFTTVSTAALTGTSLSGVIADPGPDLTPGTPDDVGSGPDGILMTADDVYKLPIQGVKVYIAGFENQAVYTDANGRFILPSVPSGDAKLFLDGRTATNPPAGIYFPEMVLDLNLQVGKANTLMAAMQASGSGNGGSQAAPITTAAYLPRLQTALLQNINNGTAAHVTISAASSPDLTSQQRSVLSVDVPAGSLIGPDGQPMSSAQLGLSTVPASLVMDMLPPGLTSIKTTMTLQAIGVAKFANPLPITLPNIYGAAAGTQLNLFSYDHATGRLAIDGTATVSTDGSSVKSDPGSGIRFPGWFFLAPPGSSSDGPGPNTPPTPPCLNPGQVVDTILDLGVQIAKCAAGFSGLRQGLGAIFNIAVQTRELISNVSDAIDAYHRGATVGEVRNIIKSVNAAKQIVVNAFDILKAQSPLDKAMAISRCIEDLLSFASGVCDKVQGTPACNTTAVKITCLGIGLAKTQLAEVNDLITAAEKGLRDIAIALLCAKLDQIATILGVVPGAMDAAGDGTITGAALSDQDPVPPEILTLLQGSLSDAQDALANAQPMEAWASARDSFEQSSVAVPSNAAAWESEWIGMPPKAYYLFQYENGFQLRGRADANGHFAVQLPPDSDFVLTMYDGANDRIAEFSGHSNRSGVATKIPSVAFASTQILDPDNQRIYVDTDKDGLVDLAESVIGTNPNKTDTNNDGIGDGAAVKQGLDPLGNFGSITGDIASLPIQGTAKRIVVAASNTSGQQLAYIATGSAGLSIVDASAFTKPILLSQFALGGDSTDVAVDANSNTVVVASNAGGLNFIDVTNPAAPTLRKTVSVTATHVQIVNGVVYATVGSSIYSYDMLSGEPLQTLNLAGNSITGMTHDGSTLYTMDAGKVLRAIDVSGTAMTAQGSLTVASAGGASITVQNGVAYVGTPSGFTGGFATVNVADPNNLVLLGTGGATNVAGGAVISNGSGKGIGVGTVGGVYAFDVFNFANLSNSATFLTRFTLPQAPYDVAIASGIAYVADGSGGLQVFNYLPFDTGGVAPTVTISTPATDVDAVTAGLQLPEGSIMPITANVGDDVQVAKVELLINGAVTQTDVSFPWDLATVLPKLAAGATTVTVQVRATDTGGNIGLSNIITVNLVHDTTPPVAIASYPGSGARPQSVPSITVTFNKPLDSTLFDPSKVTITNLGADGAPGGGDDTTFAVSSLTARNFGRTIVINPALPLTPGKYVVNIDPSMIADGAGNHLAAAYVLNFTRRPLITPLTIGTTVTDIVGAPGELETYTFTGVVGQRLYFDGLAGSQSLLATLKTPTGVAIFSNLGSTSNNGPFTLPEAGTYNLVLSGNGSTTGTYSFRLLDLAAAPLVTLGTPVGATLDLTSRSDIYTINGAAGQRIFIEDLSTGDNSESSSRFSLYGPDNQQIDSEYLVYSVGNYHIEAVLPVSGQYTLVASAGQTTKPEVYSLRVTAAPTNTTAIALGTAISGNIAVAGQHDVYTFSGTGGQRLYYDALFGASNPPTATLLSPSGATVFSNGADTDHAQFELVETGTYRLTIAYPAANNSTRAYSFQMMDVGAQLAIPLNTTVNGSFAAPKQAQVYRFTGAAGQKLYFDDQSVSTTQDSSSVWQLFAPNGQSVISSSYLFYPSNNDFETVLQAAGIYTLVFSSSYTTPGAFSFRVLDETTNPTPLTLGALVSGNLNPARSTDLYTFTGTAGQKIFFDGQDSHSASVNFDLIAPSGTGVTSGSVASDTGPFTLPESGTYHLNVHGLSDIDGSYSFRLLDVAGQTAVTFATPVSGQLSPAVVSNAYSFIGAANQTVYFDSLAAANPSDSSSRWTLYGPNNQSLGSAYLVYGSGSSNYSDFEVKLPTAGQYTLVLNSGTPSPVNYSFQLLDESANATALVLGNTVTGNMTTPRRTDLYTFTGTQGQNLLFDGLDAHGTSVRVTITSPSGTDVLSNVNTDADSAPFALTESGVYRVKVTGNNDTPGTYGFRLLDLAAQNTVALSSPVSGSLNPANASTVFKLAATAGQRLYFDGIAPGNPSDSSSRWTLYGPTNQSLGSNYLVYGSGNGNYTDFSVTIPTTGNYALVLNTGQGSPVNYNFQVLDTTAGGTALTLGTTVSGNLTTPRRTDFYTFNGSVGQRIYFDGIDAHNSTVTATLKAPSGTTLFTTNTDVDSGSYTLTEAGAYALTISGNNDTPGTYSFRVLDAAAQPAITLGAAVSGTLTLGYRTDVYTISGTAGQKLHINPTGGNANGAWRLLGPNDAVLGSAGLTSAFDVTLTSSGTFLLVLSGSGVNPVAYAFTVTNTGDAPVTAAGLNVVHSGSIIAGQQLTFTFTASAGTPLLFNNQNASGTPLYFDLKDPTNAIVFSSTTSNQRLVLSRSGVYTVTVRGQTASSTGNFSFVALDEVANATSLTLGATVSSTLSPARGTAHYTFSGSVGQHLYFDPLSNTGTGSMQLFAPSGTNVLNADTVSDQGPFTLTEAGTYRLVVSGISDTAAAYNFRLLDLSTQTAVTLGTTVSGTLTPGSAVAAFRVTGTAGQKLYFDNLNPADAATSTSSRWYLYDSNNSNLGSAYLSPYYTTPNDFEVTLPSAGTYNLLLVGSNAAVTVPYSFRVLDEVANATALTLNTTVTGTLTVARSTDLYTFSGTAGQRLYLDGLSGVGNPSLRLIAPSGAVVQNTNTISDLDPFMLTETGTYRVTVSGVSDTSATYNFRLMDIAAQPTVTLGASITGSLNPGDMGVIYQITGTSGQRLYFDNQSASDPNNNNNSSRWYLYSPSQQYLNVAGYLSPSYTSSNDFEITLPKDGAYTLLLDGNNSTKTLNYAFRVFDETANSTVLALGSTVTATLNPTRSTDLYRFTGTPGQKLYFDGQDAHGSTVYVTLTSPTGASIFSNINADTDRGPFTLTEGGIYRMSVTGYNDTPGGYRFRLLDVSAQSALTPGLAVSGALAGKQAAVYTLSGNAGQRFYFDTLTPGISGDNSTWALYSPSDSSLGSANLAYTAQGYPPYSDFVVTLPSTGTYTLVLFGNDPTTLNYTIRASNTTTNAQPLVIGSQIVGNLASARSTDLYTFNGTSGQRLYFDGFDAHGSYVTVNITSPNGTVLVNNVNADADNAPFTLSETGAYSVTVSGTSDVAGSYGFRILDLASQPQVTLGATLTNTLSPGRQADVYRLTGTAGERLFFNAKGNDSNGSWYLYSPTNQNLGSANFRSNFSLTLPGDGTYTLVFSASSATTAFYRAVVTAPPTITSALTLGATLNGNIAAVGQQNILTFNGVAGQRLYYDALLTNSDPLYVTFVAPSGRQVFFQSSTSDTAPFTLTETGGYKLIIGAYNTGYSTIGDYSFRLVDLASQPSITLNTPTFSTLNPGQGTDIYHINVLVPSQLKFSALGNDTFGSWYLYGPGNVLINGVNLTSDFLATLPAGGDYILVLSGTRTNGPVDYGFNVANV